MYKTPTDLLSAGIITTNYEKEIQKKIQTLSQSIRWLIYLLLIISNILISFDQGSIPASTNQLYKLVKSNQVIGLFASLVFIGNIIGSCISFYLINKISRKILLFLSLLLFSFCLFTFILFKQIYFLLINRILCGIFQSFITIYLPIWCNQYGIMNMKTFMLYIAQFVVPIGIFLGYMTATIFINYNYGWKGAFIIQSILVFIISFLFLFIPNIYFENDLYGYYEGDNEQTFFKEGNSLSMSYNNSLISANSILDIFYKISKEKKFLLIILSLSTLYYVITGVQFWINDYMYNILKIQSNNTRFYYYTIICFTSPLSGILIGSFLINLIGGYDKKNSMLFCLIFAFFASIFAFFVPLTRNINLFIFLLWLVLFFGGGIVPIMTGISISVLPRTLQVSGNSLQSLTSNLFGYLPAPFIYGVFTDFYKDKGKFGMMFNMYYSFVGVGLLGIVTFIKFQEKDDGKIELE